MFYKGRIPSNTFQISLKLSQILPLWVFSVPTPDTDCSLVYLFVFIGLIWDGGVYRIDFNYVAQRWASPFWQTWDLLMLWLAQLHGGNGMRTIIADYSRKDSTKFWLNTLLALSVAFTLVLGTYVLLTFDATIS